MKKTDLLRFLSSVLLLFLLSVVSQAATITYKLTTHVDGRTLTASASVTAGTSLLQKMPQSLWRAYCTYKFYTDQTCSQEIVNAPSSNSTVYVDYVFDPPFILSDGKDEPVWQFLRTYNENGQHTYTIYYKQSAENEVVNKQTIKAWEYSTYTPRPTVGTNNAMSKQYHDEWAFYGDAYSFHIMLHDYDITNRYLVWADNYTNSNFLTNPDAEHALILGAKKDIGWQLYVNTASNNHLSGGTMAMGIPNNSATYMASLENLNSCVESQKLDEDHQFNSHQELVASSNNSIDKKTLWWYAFFASPANMSPNITDIWHITYKILMEYQNNEQRGDDIIKQKPQSTAIAPSLDATYKLEGYEYAYFKDPDLTVEYTAGETIPTGCNTVVYVRERLITYISNHWITVVCPVDKPLSDFGTASDGTSPAVRALEYSSLNATDKGNNVYDVVLNFTPVNQLDAHKPYLFKVDEMNASYVNWFAEAAESATYNENDLLPVTLTDASEPGVSVTMVGTYDGVTLQPQASSEAPIYFYFGYNPKYDPTNEDAYVGEEAAAGKTAYNFYLVKKDVSISPFVCYFYAAGASGLGNFSMVYEADGISEVIEGVDNMVGMAPMQGVYTLSGQMMSKEKATSGLPAGIYVVNGKKMVIK
jgi:hypothetical protein